MEIGQLEAFERVARDGSFTRAAVALGLTQPAVSTRITTLEAELGGTLFERRGKTLKLTPLGVYFLPYTRRLLAVRDDARTGIEQFHSGKLGEVRIAAPTPFVLSFLVEVLANYRFQYPTVDIFIRERNKTAIFDLLYDRIMTLGLVNAPIYDEKFTILARFEDPIRAIVGKHHPLAGHTDPLEMADIYRNTIYRVSMFPRMTAFIDTLVEEAHRHSGHAIIKVPMVMARELVKRDEGVTFLPQAYVQPLVDRGELAYLDLVDMPRLMSQPVLITRRGYELDNVHMEFVRILNATLRDLRME